MRYVTCLLIALWIVACTRCATGQNGQEAHASDKPQIWPNKGWATASPTSVGIDEQALLKLDKDMSSGTYSQMIDSFAVFRCGKKVFERTYPHDYAKIYAKEAGERGAYNMRLNGPYNYFDPYWHPYYHGTDLHTMQSISKTVTSVILGAAIDRATSKPVWIRRC